MVGNYGTAPISLLLQWGGRNPSIKATFQVYLCASCSKYLSNVVIEVSIAHWAIVERFRRRDVQFSDHKQQSETIESGNSMANGSMASTQALSPQQQRPMTLVGPYGIELGSSNFHISSSSSTPKQWEATISQTLQPVCNNALWPMSALMDCTVLSWREGTFTFAEGYSKTKQSSTYGTKIFFSSEPIEISSQRKKKPQNLSAKKANIQW